MMLHVRPSIKLITIVNRTIENAEVWSSRFCVCGRFPEHNILVKRIWLKVFVKSLSVKIPMLRLRLGFSRFQMKVKLRQNTASARRRARVITSFVLQKAVSSSCIVCVTAGASEPILRGKWFRADRKYHINGVGSYRLSLCSFM